MEFLSYFRGKNLTFFSCKRMRREPGKVKDINRGPMGTGQEPPTLWLRSVTPADLKSGNLMPAVSGTAWKRLRQDVLMEETQETQDFIQRLSEGETQFPMTENHLPHPHARPEARGKSQATGFSGKTPSNSLRKILQFKASLESSNIFGQLV